jgi:hypothetical protein
VGLTEVQHALARLYTDGPFRERFFTAPAAVGQELGLAAEEAEQLVGSRVAIARFARSLQIKRLGEAGRFLPATRRHLGSRYGPLFLEYAPAPPPTGSRKPQEDALRFARFLAARPEALPEPWLADLARFETAWIEAGNPRRRLLVHVFRWPVQRLAGADAPVVMRPERCVGIWLRWGSQRRLVHHWLCSR